MAVDPKIEIRPPFFEIGPKAYMYGRQLVDLARRADALSREHDVQVILTPQAVDIAAVSAAVERVLVFAQHMDSLRPGRGVGSVLPEAIRAAGASGGRGGSASGCARFGSTCRPGGTGRSTGWRGPGRSRPA